ncbi:unnamed protein product [Didymodactylos carnosus]|uniref:Polycomb protein VEFS-Box domain-containing protein n=1 Tax=Didymodactylos carnosus TaxID=1234261 RepID=A0A814U6Q4_9BILA|nr:unnamed protein product [Didymodactylos carnosus]CAF1170643.1 unnamed protein product [Didymodactylos carnosus]CAF3769202.1 unnamed protein product [Didymodactylos carnosus]CAF3934381.1 unnamed protein product [Didymodactylos carnosus]
MSDCAEGVAALSKHMIIYKTLEMRWRVNPYFLHRNLKYVHMARKKCTRKRPLGLNDIVDHLLSDNQSLPAISTSNESFNLHLHSWRYDQDSLLHSSSKQDVSFELLVTRDEHPSQQQGQKSSHSVRLPVTTVSLFKKSPKIISVGKINSINSIRSNENFNKKSSVEETTISINISSKYNYTLIFSSIVLRNDNNEYISSSYAKSVQLDSLFNSNVSNKIPHKIEILLPKTGNEPSEQSALKLYFEINREFVETVGGSRSPFSSARNLMPSIQLQRYIEPTLNTKRTTQDIRKMTKKDKNNQKKYTMTTISPASLIKMTTTTSNGNKYNQLFYHFYFGKQAVQRSYAAKFGQCCFCQFLTVNNDMDVLKKHLFLCHPRFTAIFKKMTDGPTFEIRLNRSYDCSLDTYDEYKHDKFCPQKRRCMTELIIWRPACNRRSQFADINYICRRPNLARCYRHTTGALKVEPEHIEDDSDDDLYPEWTKQLTRRLMEDFQDVNDGEKEMMIIWNNHVMKYNFIADSQMALACELFVENHGNELIEKNLIKNFYLHLITLQLYNLLRKSDVAKCVVRLKTFLSYDKKHKLDDNDENNLIVKKKMITIGTS